MSQAGIINVIENNPSIPIFFEADTGFAVAMFNIIHIVGAGGTTTSAAGNTITITSSATAVETLTGNTGGPLTPTANNFNIFGGSVAAASTPVQVNGSVSTLTVNIQKTQAIVSSNSTKVGLASFDAGVFDVDANGFVTIKNSGFKWNDVTGTSANLVKENGYAADNVGLVTLTLPSVASSTFGDTIKVAGFGSGGWLIAQNASQKIIFGSTSTTVGVGGSLASTNADDQIEITCSPNTNFWIVRNSVGNLIVT